MSTLGKGERKDKGKLRFDLVNPLGHRGMVQVLTKGANKYADHNWENGMPWSKVIGSLKRHLNALEIGEDYDIDPTCEKCQQSTKDNWVCSNHTGELHADLLQCNAHFLSTYYRIFPQGDDRYLKVRPQPKIALDVDEVVCNWVEHWCELHNIDIPSSWYFQWDIKGLFDNMKAEGTLDEFYSGLSSRINPDDMPFEPVAYISHRPVADTITKKWLEAKGFPLKPVYHVENRSDKIKIAKDLQIDIFVDDSYETFKAMNEAGVCCFLMDAKHNRRYDVGFKRIISLRDIFNP